jgi:hypothetical protein
VHLFRLSLLVKAEPRLETGEDERHFLTDVHTPFFV